MTTISPAARVGARACSTQARKMAPLIGPSMTKGAVTLSWRSAARKVVVFQWPGPSRRRTLLRTIWLGWACAAPPTSPTPIGPTRISSRSSSTGMSWRRRTAPDRGRLFDVVGSREPLYSSAVGRVLLAFQPPEWRRLYLQRTKLESLTPKTIASKRELERLLAFVRRERMAISPSRALPASPRCARQGGGHPGRPRDPRSHIAHPVADGGAAASRRRRGRRDLAVDGIRRRLTKRRRKAR